MDVNVNANETAKDESGTYKTAQTLPLSPMNESAVAVEIISSQGYNTEFILTESNKAYQLRKNVTPSSPNEDYDEII